MSRTYRRRLPHKHLESGVEIEDNMILDYSIFFEHNYFTRWGTISPRRAKVTCRGRYLIEGKTNVWYEHYKKKEWWWKTGGSSSYRQHWKHYANKRFRAKTRQALYRGTPLPLSLKEVSDIWCLD